MGPDSRVTASLDTRLHPLVHLPSYTAKTHPSSQVIFSLIFSREDGCAYDMPLKQDGEYGRVSVTRISSRLQLRYHDV